MKRLLYRLFANAVMWPGCYIGRDMTQYLVFCLPLHNL